MVKRTHPDKLEDLGDGPNPDVPPLPASTSLHRPRIVKVALPSSGKQLHEDWLVSSPDGLASVGDVLNVHDGTRGCHI